MAAVVMAVVTLTRATAPSRTRTKAAAAMCELLRDMPR